MPTPLVTILLLDDEPLLRRATALLLTNRGGSVTAAATPEDAVALAAARPYDVAIVDVPAPHARDVLRRMRAGGTCPRRVIVVSDGAVDVGDAAELSDVLCKPYPFERLLAAVFGAREPVRARRSGRAHARLRLTPAGPRRAARAARGLAARRGADRR
jgi:DNA-binding response OmpR family regulator